MTVQYINKVQLVGRVGQDPDLRYFESGAVKAKLTLAVKPPYKSDNPQWWELEFWSNTAQTVANYVAKGSTIGVSGELRFEAWVDKNTGLPRSKPVIKVEQLELLSSSKRGSDNSSDSSESVEPKQDLANANY